MSMHVRHWPVGIALVIGLIVLVGLGARTPVTQAHSMLPDRIAAQQRWAQRPFDRYRMVVRVAGICTRTLEVEHGELVTLGGARLCLARVRTVDDLFEVIAAMPAEQPRITSYQSVRGDRCIERAAWQVQYDPVWGVPQRLELLAGSPPPWEQPQVWWRALAQGRLPDCPLLRTHLQIEVLEFTPLQ